MCVPCSGDKGGLSFAPYMWPSSARNVFMVVRDVSSVRLKCMTRQGRSIHILNCTSKHYNIIRRCTELSKALFEYSCEAMQVSVASRNIVDVRMACLHELRVGGTRGPSAMVSGRLSCRAYVRFIEGFNIYDC